MHGRVVRKKWGVTQKKKQKARYRRLGWVWGRGRGWRLQASAHKGAFVQARGGPRAFTPGAGAAAHAALRRGRPGAAGWPPPAAPST